MATEAESMKGWTKEGFTFESNGQEWVALYSLKTEDDTTHPNTQRLRREQGIICTYVVRKPKGKALYMAHEFQGCRLRVDKFPTA